MDIKKEAPKNIRVKTKGGNVRVDGKLYIAGILYKVDRETALKIAEEPRMQLLDEIPAEEPEEKSPEEGTIDISEDQEKALEDEKSDDSTAEDKPAAEEEKPEEAPSEDLQKQWDAKLAEFDALTIAKTEDWLDGQTHVPFLEFLRDNCAKKGSKANVVIRIAELTE